MSHFINELRKLTIDLKELSIDWALVGGLAYSIYAEPRTTKDIDLVLSLTDESQLEYLVNELLSRGYLNKQILMHMSPAHRLGVRVSLMSQKNVAIPIDLLTATCGVEKEIIVASKNIEILPSIFMPVASLSHILAMKILAQDDSERIRDKADAIALIAAASSENIEETKKALILITERGFNRGKDLISDFNKLLKRRH